MSGEINDDLNRRRRPIPVPLYDDRYIERPYLKKVELARIRDNLDELVDIKTGFVENKPKIEMPEPKKDNKKEDFFLTSSDTNATITKPSKVESKVSELSKPEPKKDDTNILSTTASTAPINIPIITSFIENKPEIKNEIKKDDIKLGISNLGYNKENKKIDIIDNKQISTLEKNKKKIIRRKVNIMDEEQQGYNVSPEDRRRMRKAELKEFNEEDESLKAIRKSADLAEQNAKELKEFKLNFAKENDEIKRELKSEISNKFGQVDQKFSDMNGKFNEVGGRFDKLSGKLEETCTGIDCLKKDLANMNKNFDLVECPECGQKVVPPLASFCPSCSAKMYSWTDDDGKLVKGWKPTWEK